ncbi:hypothetical protein Q8F55_004828 [Vanrija albida]|uniref:Vitellogenin domain-containing protein n=1 Tax=Vanrija albida TaxID=181172 RepID=A0ABR3Q0J4_9TREE
MTLVYSGTPRLYPELGGGALVAAVRFSTPMRLASVRVVPAGVVYPGGVGATSAEPFAADVWLNVSPSDPINALARTALHVEPGPHSVDYALDMPEGTTTRLLVLRLHPPGTALTLSLYAHSPAASATADADASQLALSGPTELPLPDTAALLSALAARLPGAYPTAEVAARTERLRLADALAHPAALAALLADPGADAAVASLLGLDAHPDPRAALSALARLDAPNAVEYPRTAAPLATVLALARAQRDSAHPQAGAALATVVGRLAALLPASPAIARTLAAALPALAAHAAARGADVALPGSLEPRAAVAALLPLLAGSTPAGISTAPAAAALARPFVARLDPADPLRLAWASPIPSPALASSSEATRLARALDTPAASSSLLHTPSAPELLALLAPALAATLAHAREPPLGIPSALPRVVASGAAASASDYAGKVYSAHEFRRERETVSGLGVGASGVGRKASRHVDEFGR